MFIVEEVMDHNGRPLVSSSLKCQYTYKRCKIHNYTTIYVVTFERLYLQKFQKQHFLKIKLAHNMYLLK